MLTRRRTRDEGFTLIELMITITIISVIAYPLMGMMFQYLRNANETNSRLTESSDPQFVSAFWQQDVSSLGTHGAVSGGTIPNGTSGSVWLSGNPVPTGVPSGCSAIANMVVGFAWNDYQNASSTDGTATWTAANNASVYFTDTNKGQTRLWRARCSGATVQTNILAHYLTQAPAVVCSSTCNAATPPSTVSITLNVHDLSRAEHASTALVTTLTAARRQG